MNQKRYRISMIGAVALLLVLILAAPAIAQNEGEEGWDFAKGETSAAIKVYVDGTLLMPADDSQTAAPPLLQDGTVYLPLWAVRKALGKPVEWDSATNSVYIGESAEIQEITVSTAEELIFALGSNRRILLKEGVYNLTAVAAGYVSANVYFGERPDGSELFLDGIQNMTLEGIGDGECEIVVEPRYANVMNFRDCAGISIVNIKAGHTEDGMCSGGVFLFENCTGIQIDRTQMYGCGTLGLMLSKVQGIKVTGSTIYGCTMGIMSIHNSSDILLKDCVFRDNAGTYLISAEHVSGLAFDSCSFQRNAEATYMFYLSASENIAIQNTEFTDNIAQMLSSGEELTVDDTCMFAGNLFDAAR